MVAQLKPNLTISVVAERRASFYRALAYLERAYNASSKSAVIVQLVLEAREITELLPMKNIDALLKDVEVDEHQTSGKANLAISIPLEHRAAFYASLQQLREQGKLSSTSAIIAWIVLDAATRRIVRDKPDKGVDVQNENLGRALPFGAQNAGHQLVGGVQSLDVLWGMYYAGETKDLGDLLPVLQRKLRLQNDAIADSPERLTKNAQLVAVVLSDQGNLVEAIEASNLAIHFAEQIGEVSIRETNLVSALYRRAGVLNQFYESSRDTLRQKEYLTQATADIERALSLAEPSRPILRAVVIQRAAELRAQNGDTYENVMALLNSIDYANHLQPIYDESGVVISSSAFFHVRARIALTLHEHQQLEPSQLDSALKDIDNAIKGVRDNQTRWIASMRLTRMGLLMARGLFMMVLEEAQTFRSVILHTGSERMRRRFVTIIKAVSSVSQQSNKLLNELCEAIPLEATSS